MCPHVSRHFLTHEAVLRFARGEDGRRQHVLHLLQISLDGLNATDPGMALAKGR